MLTDDNCIDIPPYHIEWPFMVLLVAVALIHQSPASWCRCGRGCFPWGLSHRGPGGSWSTGQALLVIVQFVWPQSESDPEKLEIEGASKAPSFLFKRFSGPRFHLLLEESAFIEPLIWMSTDMVFFLIYCLTFSSSTPVSRCFLFLLIPYLALPIMGFRWRNLIFWDIQWVHVTLL